MAHYASAELASFPWIVSTDTLRTEDLLVRYWQTAEQLAQLADRPQLINPSTLAGLEKLVGEDSRESDWNDQQAAELLEYLHETLQDVAPHGFYFGASEGDGACFGFWLDDAWVEALEHCGWAADSDPAALADVIRELEADGIDCDNFQDAYAGSAEGHDETEAGADFAQSTVEEQGLLPTVSAWPFYCIDWEFAWRELVVGDGFRLHRISGNDWAVFRAV